MLIFFPKALKLACQINILWSVFMYFVVFSYFLSTFPLQPVEWFTHHYRNKFPFFPFHFWLFYYSCFRRASSHTAVRIFFFVSIFLMPSLPFEITLFLSLWYFHVFFCFASTVAHSAGNVLRFGPECNPNTCSALRLMVNRATILKI